MHIFSISFLNGAWLNWVLMNMLLQKCAFNKNEINSSRRYFIYLFRDIIYKPCRDYLSLIHLPTGIIDWSRISREFGIMSTGCYHIFRIYNRGKIANRICYKTPFVIHARFRRVCPVLTSWKNRNSILSLLTGDMCRWNKRTIK